MLNVTSARFPKGSLAERVQAASSSRNDKRQKRAGQRFGVSISVTGTPFRFRSKKR
jgi:hypothetical protein